MSEPVKPHHLVSEPEKTRQILAAKFKDLDLQEHDLIEEEECEAPVEGSRNVGISHVWWIGFQPEENLQQLRLQQDLVVWMEVLVALVFCWLECFMLDIHLLLVY